MLVLIAHGGRDLQISNEDDRALLAQARPDAGLVLIAAKNHVLKIVVSGDRNANVSAYFNPEFPIVSGVVDAIAEFIGKPRRCR